MAVAAWTGHSSTSTCKYHPLLDSESEKTMVQKPVVSGVKGVAVADLSSHLGDQRHRDRSGEAVVPLILDGCRISFALISPDIEEMLGADWLQTHNCLWNFGHGKFLSTAVQRRLERARSRCATDVFML